MNQKELKIQSDYHSKMMVIAEASIKKYSIIYEKHRKLFESVQSKIKKDESKKDNV